MTELGNHRFADIVRVIDSGKDHQQMLKPKSENGLRNRLLTQLQHVSPENTYYNYSGEKSNFIKEKPGQSEERKLQHRIQAALGLNS